MPVASPRAFVETRCPLLYSHEGHGIGLPPALLPPPSCPSLDSLLGPAHCVRRLGSGGFGDVWLARCSEAAQAKFVALKFVPLGMSDEDTTTGDVKREVAAHHRLFSQEKMLEDSAMSSLVRLEAHVIEADRAVLALELVEGIELLDYVAHQPNGCPAGWLEEIQARPVVVRLVSALAYMHACGVAHLDLKPQNVLYDPRSGRLKLIDYGSAGLFEPGATGSPGALVEENGGTQSYQSPERLLDEAGEGEGNELFNGPAADIFSLGCLTFFLLCGRVPYDWETARHRSSRMALDRYEAKHRGEKDPWSGVEDPLEVLMARVKVNDPFGKDECESEDEDDDDDDEGDMKPLPSAAATDFVRSATRYEVSGRPAAQVLASHPWLIPERAVLSSAETQTPEACLLETALGKLALH